MLSGQLSWYKTSVNKSLQKQILLTTVHPYGDHSLCVCVCVDMYVCVCVCEICVIIYTIMQFGVFVNN